MARAWIYQDAKQVKQHGEAKASWYVGWYEPDGKQKCKSYGPGSRGKQNAEKAQRRIEGELAAGVYQSECRKTWEEFRKEYEEKVLAGKKVGTRGAYKYCLDNFERIISPARMRGIKTKTIADFVAARRKEDGLKPKTLVSAATINKELRHLRAVLRKAHRWGYLPVLPEFEFEKEAKKLPIYIPDEHFVAIYAACEAAKTPRALPNGLLPSVWWQALIVMAYMTGWRISSLMAMRWSDVDLEAGTALSEAQDNKGGRDQLVPLHPIVVEHLARLKVAFSEYVFPWSHNRRMLWLQFQRLQTAANAKPTRKPWYGFHDLRRGFATNNADRMTPDALQRLMAHKDYKTTQGYINMARQLKPAVQDLFVPSIGKAKTSGEETGT